MSTLKHARSRASKKHARSTFTISDQFTESSLRVLKSVPPVARLPKCPEHPGTRGMNSSRNHVVLKNPLIGRKEDILATGHTLGVKKG